MYIVPDGSECQNSLWVAPAARPRLPPGLFPRPWPAGRMRLGHKPCSVGSYARSAMRMRRPSSA
jgi:hypothetical protein